MYQLLNAQQANPVLTGMGMAQDVQSSALKNQYQKLLNQYAPQNMSEDLRGKTIGNDLSQVQLNYAPQTAQAGLDNTRANTGYTNEQTKYYGFDQLIKAQQANQQGSRFGAAYQLKQQLASMAPAARSQWIANNQDAYNEMLTDVANGNKTASLITPTALNKYFPGMGIGGGQQPQIPPIQSNDGGMTVQPLPAPGQAPAAVAPGVNTPNNYPTLPGGTQPMQGNQALPQGAVSQPQHGAPGQRFAYQTPAQNAITQQANQMSANNYLTTAATRRQMEGAIQIENFVNDPELKNKVLSSAQYAGALGRGKQAVDALMQQNPKAYENYISLTRHDLPLLGNRIKTLDQMGVTDKQKAIIENMFDKTMDSLTSNPEQFVIQFNQLNDALARLAKSVQTSATPLGGVHRLQGYKPIEDIKNQLLNQRNPQAQQGAPQQPAQQPMQEPTTKQIGGNTYHKVNGQWYQQ